MRWPTALLALALASPALGFAGDAPADGTDRELQAEMERLFALRTQDPQAFVAQVRSLDSLPLPTTVAQREFLVLLQANRATLEGRFADAIALAKPLAEGAEDEALRLRAGALVVNLLAGTREFETGLRRLGELLRAHPEARPGLENEYHVLWGVASTLYNEMGQHELAIDFADRTLEAKPAPREACLAGMVREFARQNLRDATQTQADFDAARQRCREAGETVPALFVVLAQARHLRAAKRLADALALMEDQLGAFETARYPRLVAEAYALDAELLFEAARYADAERQAREAVARSKDLPTGRPMAMAEKVLFEIARRKGDDATALQHLQRHVAATRALADEARIKELAFRTVQHEMLQQEREHALLVERHRVLDLEAQVAKAESRNALFAVSALGLTLLGLGVWGWRLARQARGFRTLAEVDGLTGFANRQHFATCAEAALRLAERESRPLALISFDLDHFKRINDEHGHLAGDAVLRAVSDAVRAVPDSAGVTRLVGRMGGEEFAILLEPATLETAIAHAEACRTAISGARAMLGDGVAIGATASFGIACTHDTGHALQALLAASDRSLYRAKARGRDQVCGADSDAGIDAGAAAGTEAAPAAERVAA